MAIKQFRDTVMTNDGFAVSNRASLGKNKFEMTRAVSTEVDLSGYKTDDLKNLTSLPGEIETGVLTDFDMKGDNVSAIKINFNNENFKDGYIVRAVGIYAKEEGSDKEILHSVTVSDTPVNIPGISGNVFDGFYLTVAIFSGSNQNISVRLSDETTATVKYVDEAIANLNVPEIRANIQKNADNINVLDGKIGNNRDAINGLKDTKADKTALDVVNNDLKKEIADNYNGLNGGKADKSTTDDLNNRVNGNSNDIADLKNRKADQTIVDNVDGQLSERIDGLNNNKADKKSFDDFANDLKNSSLQDKGFLPKGTDPNNVSQSGIYHFNKDDLVGVPFQDYGTLIVCNWHGNVSVPHQFLMYNNIETIYHRRHTWSDWVALVNSEDLNSRFQFYDTVDEAKNALDSAPNNSLIIARGE